MRCSGSRLLLLIVRPSVGLEVYTVQQQKSEAILSLLASPHIVDTLLTAIELPCPAAVQRLKAGWSTGSLAP